MTNEYRDLELEQFRSDVAKWCTETIPREWRQEHLGQSERDFVEFQQWWFAQLRAAGYAVPHWPSEWGGGMTPARQAILYQQLAAHDAPRLVLHFVSIHHAASTLLGAGTESQQIRHLPAILDGTIWCQGFSEPGAGSDLASLSTTAVRDGERFIVNGQKVWVSGAMHASWCLLLARTDPDAPKRRGISYFLLDMATPGIDVRPIRQASGDSHFCEMFLDDVEIPAANLIGPENDGWQVAQATLASERGMTMLELAERLGTLGFAWLLDLCRRTRTSRGPLIHDTGVRRNLAEFEIELAGLRGLCRRIVADGHAGPGPADASIVKLYYSELLQRLTDFGAEIAGVDGMRSLEKPRSSGWESGLWMLDFVTSWEWTIPGGSSEIQRTIIAERGLGMPRDIESKPAR